MKTFQFIAFGFLFLIPKSGWADNCVIGEMRVGTNRNLEICENGIMPGSRNFSNRINNAHMINFLQSVRSNPAISQATQTAFNYSADGLISYFQQEVAASRFTTRMFADNEAEANALQVIATAHNQHLGLQAAINTLQRETREREAKLRERIELTNNQEILKIGQDNQAEIAALTPACERSQSHRTAGGSRMRSLQILFDDGQEQRTFPTRVESRGNSLFISFRDRQGAQTREIRHQGDERFIYIGGDGRQYPARIRSESFLQLTQIRPLGGSATSDECFLIWQQNRPAQAAPAGASGPQPQPGQTMGN
jgi:hypothetical protein